MSYSILKISRAAYDEIAARIRDAYRGTLNPEDAERYIRDGKIIFHNDTACALEPEEDDDE